MNRLNVVANAVTPYNRYLYFALAGLNGVATAIQLGAIASPPEYHNLPFFAAVISTFLMIFLHAFQD